ncbi:MAG: M48 family metalloprotease, partial [Planctomycetes bacterium]|nr:M48 family metalloprotease [Planctomycetota bacterium]
PRAVMATMAEALLEASYESRPPRPVASILMPGWRDVWPAIRIRLGWPLLALLPALLLGASMDLLQLWRDGYVFVMATTAGLSVATIAYLLLAAMLLPFWFRVAFGVRAELPEPVGTALRETAARLGFSPDRVFVLPTGMRAVNAMMVGPLPVGRLLCLTDGLLSTLDARSLSGVLAHEVGHARMGHPGLLMLLAVIVPLMLLSPLRLLDLDQVDVVLQAVVLLGATLLVWLSVRGLARRFEHEADVSSVQVLGAEPCSRALLTVARLTLPQSSSLRGRLLSLHPDERHRLELMRRYEQEPTFRDQFDRKTRRLRRGVFGVLLFAVAAGAWFWLADWPYERVIVRFHTGDFVGARAALDELEERPARWRESLQVLEQELDAADQLQPGLRDWDSVERALVPAAWQRGEQVLLRDGPAAARPWLSLALTAMPSPTTTQLAVHAFCRAAADQDPDRMLRAARIVLRLGVPPGLAPVFRDYR